VGVFNRGEDCETLLIKPLLFVSDSACRVRAMVTRGVWPWVACRIERRTRVFKSRMAQFTTAKTGNPTCRRWSFEIIQSI